MRPLLALLYVSYVLAKCPLSGVPTYDNKACLVFSDEFATWTAAENLCRNLGGHLNTFHSKEESDYIVGLAEKADFCVEYLWVGAKKGSGVWKNIDGTPFDYSNFKGHPLKEPTHPVARIDVSPLGNKEGNWEEKSINDTMRFACKVPHCGSDDTTPPSLLSPTDNDTGLIYSSLIDAWYYLNLVAFNGNPPFSDEECASLGGHLPSIRNAFENSEIMRIMDASVDGFPMMLGYFANQTGWYWTDGIASRYTNWWSALHRAPNRDEMESFVGQKFHRLLTVIESRHCKSKSTGAVLIADNMPGLIVKLTFPFFMHRIPFGFRHALICGLQTASYFIVAYSSNVAMSLAGVAMGSIGCGIGEMTYLGLSSFFPSWTIAAWGSGTGGAGLVGSFSYAFLTEPNLGGLSPKTALLIQVFIPVLFAVTYWLILDAPSEVYTPGLHPRTWIVPVEHQSSRFSQSECEKPTFKTSRAATDETEEVTDIGHIYGSTATDESDAQTSAVVEQSVRVAKRKFTFLQRISLIAPLLHLMIPVALVTVAEYLINQGLTQLIFFNCHRGLNLTIHSQYKWYQVLYQLGSFLARSSVRLFELPQWILYLLPLVQFANMTLFLFEAMYWFVPNIVIIFGLILFEGLLGGASFVNTFNRIHKRVEPDVREYSMAIATVGDAIAVNIAGFVAIPLHNWVCNMKMPQRNL